MQAPGAPAPPEAFTEAWRTAAGIAGWLTEAQARMLWDEAVRVGHGARLLEIGSHRGRSTVVIAKAAQSRGGEVLAVDPFVEGRLFGGQPTREIFESNIATSGLTETVHLLADYSTRARPGWTEPIDYLYVDGKHDYWTAADDLRWSEHLPDGAAVLVHDCYSSIGVTLAILVHVLPSRRLRYERRAGSLALFRVGEPRTADRLRILAQLPWWSRNVGIKILLRLRLRSLARWVGHDSPYDPF